jgi:hypothetical protein
VFESSLKAKLKAIFDLDKVTFESAGESKEQEGAFIEIESPYVKVSDTRAVGKITGKIRFFVNADKMPHDYFAKMISKASNDDKKDLFFSDIGVSVGRLVNIDERTVSFVYFFNSQYDPNQGLITSIEIAEGES